MNYDRIIHLRISGLRCIESLSLDLRGLSVLIGDNGSGKSTVLEALELLRQAANPVEFVNDILYRRHGGLQSLLGHGSRELKLGVTVNGAGPALMYDFTIAEVGATPAIVEERLLVAPNGDAKTAQTIIERDGYKAHFQLGTGQGKVERQIKATTLAFAMQSPDVHPEIERLRRALSAIELHVPFETRPLWQKQQLDNGSQILSPRRPTFVDSGLTLARYALNLSNCYHHLRDLGDDVWTRVRDRIRLGLGDDFRDFRIPSTNPGHIALEIVYGSAPDKPVPIDSLSEGQICYLAFVALVELNFGRSLLALDEPELHLHPELLSRVVGMLEEVASSSPVLLATHSDRLLDTLTTPSQSVFLCELDEDRTTRFRRPNSQSIAEWMDTYRGLGTIRAEGYEDHVFDDGPTIGSSEKER